MKKRSDFILSFQKHLCLVPLYFSYLGCLGTWFYYLQAWDCHWSLYRSLFTFSMYVIFIDKYNCRSEKVWHVNRMVNRSCSNWLSSVCRHSLCNRTFWRLLYVIVLFFVFVLFVQGLMSCNWIRCLLILILPYLSFIKLTNSKKRSCRKNYLVEKHVTVTVAIIIGKLHSRYLGIEFYLFVSHGGMKRQRIHV